MATIKWLEREIERLKATAASERRQADRLQTQSNYNESTNPAASVVSEQAADKYNRDADGIEATIEDYQKQIEDLNRQIGEKQAKREDLQRQVDQLDREIVDMVG